MSRLRRRLLMQLAMTASTPVVTTFNPIYIFNTSSTTDSSNGPTTYNSKTINRYHFGGYTSDTWWEFGDTTGTVQGSLCFYTSAYTFSKAGFTPATGSLYYDLQTSTFKNATTNEAMCGKSPITTTLTMGEAGDDISKLSYIRFRFLNTGTYKVGIFYTDTSETTTNLSLSTLKFRLENGTNYVEQDFSGLTTAVTANTDTIIWSDPITVSKAYTTATVGSTTDNTDNSMYLKVYSTQYYSRPKATIIIIQRVT